MESRIEELEIDLEIARAKADLALRLVRYLADELARSDIANWGADDLFRQFLDETDYTDPAEEMVRLEIVPGPGEATMAEAVDLAAEHTREATRLRRQIAANIRRHRGASPS